MISEKRRDALAREAERELRQLQKPHGAQYFVGTHSPATCHVQIELERQKRAKGLPNFASSLELAMQEVGAKMQEDGREDTCRRRQDAYRR